jgi:hypothetical protein
MVGIVWGDAQLDSSLPPPETGNLLLLDQSSREMYPALLRMTASELASGHPVHWLDGACRFDPIPLMPLLHWRGVRPHVALADLHVCRGFTAHQLSAQVDRLATEASSANVPDRLANGRLVVVSNLPRMFVDPQVRRSEGGAMLRRALLRLRSIAKSTDSVVVASSSRDVMPPLPRSMRQEARTIADDVIRSEPLRTKVRKRRGEQPMRLSHESSNIGFDWIPLPWQQSSLHDFDRGHQASRLDCLRAPSPIRSSDQPNGERIAETARTANGV